MVDTLCAVLIEKLQSQKSLRIHSQKIESVASTIQIHISFFIYKKTSSHFYIIYTGKSCGKGSCSLFHLVYVAQFPLLLGYDNVLGSVQLWYSQPKLLPITVTDIDLVYVYQKMIFISKKLFSRRKKRYSKMARNKDMQLFMENLKMNRERTKKNH